MSKNVEQTNTLRDAWASVRRYRWRFLLPLFLTATAVLLLGLVLPRKYKAEAIFERRTDMVLAEIINRGAPESYQDPRQTLVEELSGKPAIDKLIDDLRPLLTSRYRYFDKQVIADDLSRRILVKSDIASSSVDRVRVTYTGDDAALSRAVVNTLVTNYISRTRRQLEARLRQTEQFFVGEVENSREQIERIENRKVAFEIDNAALLPDNPAGVPVTLTQTQLSAAEALQKRDAAVLRLQGLESALAATPATIPVVVRARNPELDRLEAKLRELSNKLSNCLGPLAMTEKHPEVIALRKEAAATALLIEGTEKEVVTQTSTSVNPRHAELELALTEARALTQSFQQQYDMYQAQLEQMTAQSVNLFPVRSDYRKLSREAEQLQRQMAFWEDNLRRVRMAMSAETGNRGVQLEFIKPCAAISLPVSPNLMQLLLAAVAGGLASGALGVYFAARADLSFREADQLALAFKLPLFGAVSEIVSTQQRRVRRFKNLVLFPTSAAAMGAALVVMTGLLYVNLEKPQETSKPATPADTTPTTLSAAPTDRR